MDLGFAPTGGKDEFHLPLQGLAEELAGPARFELAYDRYIQQGKRKSQR